MSQQTTSRTGQRRWQALSGLLFVACYFAGDFIVNSLATVPLPMPGAPAAEIVRYYTSSQSVVWGLAFFQILAALALFVFTGSVASFVGQIVSNENGRGGSQLPMIARSGGVFAALFLLVSAVLALILRPVAAGDNVGLVELLRDLNFRTGGTLHVAALGILIGASSLAARKAKALPAWINWLGLVTAVVAILSLLSFAIYYASLFILLGRMLGFVWCIAAGIALAFGKLPARAASGELIFS